MSGYSELSAKVYFYNELQFEPQDTLFRNKTILEALKIGSLFIKIRKFYVKNIS